VALACAAGAPVIACAQIGAAPTYAEYRADAIVMRGVATEVGAGVVIPADTYVRLSIDGAAGPTWRDGSVHASGRVDAIGRFLLDPFRETPVAVSLGGGVSVPYVSGYGRVRPYLAVVVDIEGRMRGGFTPALQLGLGGGARIGVVIRRSPRRYR
jgi:hypothetical protein